MKTYGRGLKSSFSSREQNLPEEYETACRLCLTKDNVTVNIYGDDVVPVALKLKDCVALEVSEDDGLPRSVCADCNLLLEQAYAFKMRCHATDVKLRQFIKIPTFSHSFSLDYDLEKKTLLEESENERSKDACTINMEDSCLIYPSDLCSNSSGNGCRNSSDHLSIIKNDINEGDDVNSHDNDGVGVEKTILNLDSDSGVLIPIKIVKIEDSIVKDSCCEDSLEADSRKDECTEENNLFVENNNRVFLKDRISTINVLKRKRKFLPSPHLRSPSHSDEGKSGGAGHEKIILRSKKQLSSSKNIYRCSSCFTKHFSYKALFDHIRLNHVETLKMCNICRKSFISNSTLERHMRTHTGERPFECHECGKRFSQKEILNRHNYTHLEDKTVKCKHCTFRCSDSEKMANHCNSMHSGLESDANCSPKFQCTKCDKAFYHASGLSRHQATHTGTIFQCSLCEKIFSDKSSARRHQTKLHPDVFIQN